MTKFNVLSILQITTAVYTLVEEYQLLREEWPRKFPISTGIFHVSLNFDNQFSLCVVSIHVRLSVRAH